MPEGVKAGTAYVDVDADLAKLKKTVDEGVPKAVDSAAAKASKGSPSRWAGLGDGLKKGIAGSLGQLSGLQIGGGVAALGVGLDALSAPAERAKASLEASFRAAGKDVADYKGQIDGALAHEENLAHSHADTETALSKLTAAYQDPKKALSELNLVSDIAAFKHISLSAAAGLVIKAHAGSSRVFKEFGIQIKKNADGTSNTDRAMKQLAQRVSGQASAAVSTFSGKLDVWKTKIQDVAAKWGEKLGPILTTAGPLIAGVGGILSSGLIPALGATEVAEDGVAVSTTSMFWPIVAIIAGIAALVAGVIYAYTHWTAFRNVVDAVGRFLRDVLWPIIQRVAADIWTAFRVYLGLVMAEWRILWAVVQWAWSNIGIPVFNAVKLAATALVAIWRTEFAVLKAVFSGLWTGLRAVWNSVGVPVFNAIKGAINGVRWAFDTLKDAVGTVFSGVAGIVHSAMHGVVHGLYLGLNAALAILVTGLDAYNAIPGVPNISGVPRHISEPSFDKGGIVPGPLGAPMQAIVHGGEEVLTPAQQRARAPHNTFNIFQSMTPDQILAAQRREDRLAYAG